MDNFSLIAKEGQPTQEDKNIMIKGLLSHYAISGHPRNSKTYSVVLKNENQKVMGMVIVTFLWNGMEINSLWVGETIRKQGWGRKLMQAVENEAIKRGCTIAYTNTFPWQSPNFYKKLGYKLYGKLDDFPKSSYLSYFYKKLI